VHRRVEVVRILDASTARRRVSIDMTVPGGLASDALDALPAVPVTWLKKEPLRRFDLRDQGGRAISVLTKTENSAAIGDAVAVAVEQRLLADVLLGGPLPGGIADVIREIVAGEPNEALALVQGLRQREAEDGSKPLRRIWATISRDALLMGVLQNVAENFALMAVMPAEPGVRRLVKMEYDEQLRRRRGWSIPRSTGWDTEPLDFEVPGVGLGQSYHLEVAAPEDLEIAKAPLQVSEVINGEVYSLGRAVDPLPPFDGSAHYYVAGAPPGSTGRAELDLQPRAAGMVRMAAMFIAGFVAFLLGAGLVRLDEVTDTNRSQVTAGVLLVAPAVLAAFVVRANEHALAARMLVGIRVALVVNVGSAVLAAALLAGNLTGHKMFVGWAACFAAAAVTALALILPLRSPASGLCEKVMGNAASRANAFVEEL
jgi:hypothetical protein